MKAYKFYPMQFLIEEPRNKEQFERIKRTGIISEPNQKTGGCCVFVWKFIDKQIKNAYGLE